MGVVPGVINRTPLRGFENGGGSGGYKQVTPPGFWKWGVLLPDLLRHDPKEKEREREE
jgi:hypothetical protein